MDGVDNGLEHGFKLKPGFVSIRREAVAYEFGESGVGEVAFVDFLKADKLLPADEFHTLSYRVGYCNAVIGRGGNNVAAAVGFAVRANEADVDGVNDGLALSGELDLRSLAIGELPAVVIDEGHSGVHVVRDVRAAAILGAELVNEVLGIKGDVAVVLPVLQLIGSDFIAGLVEIDESPVVRSSRRDAIDIDVYQLVDFISSGRFGRAHDLAGDGGDIASDYPSLIRAIPGQHERLFGVVGISMPVRDLLVVGGKNEVVIRLDGANARREVYSNIAVVLIQVETLVGVLGICVDAVEDYIKLIQLILGRLTGLAGLFRLLCLVNRGGGRNGHIADGDGIFHGLTGVRLRHGVGVVNVYGAISRDIDSDRAGVYGVTGAIDNNGATIAPHGVGDLDARGGDTVEVGDGDSVLKHIANSGRTLAVGNGNGLVYVELGHGLGARLFAGVFDAVVVDVELNDIAAALGSRGYREITIIDALVDRDGAKFRTVSGICGDDYMRYVVYENRVVFLLTHSGQIVVHEVVIIAPSICVRAYAVIRVGIAAVFCVNRNFNRIPIYIVTAIEFLYAIFKEIAVVHYMDFGGFGRQRLLRINDSIFSYGSRLNKRLPAVIPIRPRYELIRRIRIFWVSRHIIAERLPVIYEAHGVEGIVVSYVGSFFVIEVHNMEFVIIERNVVVWGQRFFLTSKFKLARRDLNRVFHITIFYICNGDVRDILRLNFLAVCAVAGYHKVSVVLFSIYTRKALIALRAEFLRPGRFNRDYLGVFVNIYVLAIQHLQHLIVINAIRHCKPVYFTRYAGISRVFYQINGQDQIITAAEYERVTVRSFADARNAVRLIPNTIVVNICDFVAIICQH